ncbi:hypothetical protein BH23VER1_BH23VER1_32280 [soil metagenome]
MRPLTSNEKRLTALFGLIVIGGGAFLGFSTISNRKAALVAKEASLKNSLFQLENLMEEREHWLNLRQWVEERLVAYRSVDERDTYLITIIRNKAEDAGVEITRGPQPLDPEVSPFYEETVVNVTVDGDIKGIVQWLYTLQDPEQFRAITSVKLTPKKEEGQLQCEITIEQWWRLDSLEIAAQSSPALPDHEPAPTPGQSDSDLDPDPDPEVPGPPSVVPSVVQSDG